MELSEEIFNEFVTRIEDKEEIDKKIKENLRRMILQSPVLTKSQIEELILNNKND